MVKNYLFGIDKETGRLDAAVCNPSQKSSKKVEIHQDLLKATRDSDGEDECKMPLKVYFLEAPSRSHEGACAGIGQLFVET